MSYFTHSSGLTYCDSVICVFFKQGNATDSGGDSLNCSSVSNFSTSFRITRNTDPIKFCFSPHDILKNLKVRDSFLEMNNVGIHAYQMLESSGLTGKNIP